MVVCCVPFCHSAAGKSPGISFHEFPVDRIDEWLKVIRRAGYKINDKSGSSVVCSIHFKKEDYVEGKKRRLKPGIIPSIFPGYPSYMQPKQAKPRSERLLHPKIVQKKTSIKKALKNAKTKLSSDFPYVQNQISLPQLNDIDSLSNAGGATSSFNVAVTNKEPAPLSVDKAVQVDGGIMQKLKEQKQKIDCLRVKLYRKEKRLKQQKFKLSEFKAHLNVHKQSSYLSVLKRLLKEPEGETKERAAFLLDQLKNFYKPQCKWSQSSLKQCIQLHCKSSKSYNLLKNTKLFKLPNKCTLQKANRSPGVMEVVTSNIQSFPEVGLHVLFQFTNETENHVLEPVEECDVA